MLSKQVIGGSMTGQKEIQDKLGKLRQIIDDRQKALIAKVKALEEEKLVEIQNASSELRAARGKIVDHINSTNALLFDTEVYELFDRADSEEKALNNVLAQVVDFNLKNNT